MNDCILMGIKIGINQGIDLSKRKIARRMLNDYINTNLIRKYTGLTRNELQNLNLR